MSAITLNFSGHEIIVSGELTRVTIDNAFEQNSARITCQSDAVLNLTAVTKIDMAGLAWLLFVVEQAKINTCQLSFIGASVELLKLAKLSAVDTFLPLQQN